MGMFDRYYVSQDFNCPNCGTKWRKEDDFQTKELMRHMESYKLGDKLETAHKYIIFDAYCPGSYGMVNVSQKPTKPPAKAICDKGHFFCRVDLDEEGTIVKETVTMLDGKIDEETIIYEKEIE